MTKVSVKEIKQNLKHRLQELEREENKAKLTVENSNAFIIFLKEPLQLNLITAEQAQEIIELVEKGQMPLKEANNLLNDIINEARGLSPCDWQLTLVVLQ